VTRLLPAQAPAWTMSPGLPVRRIATLTLLVLSAALPATAAAQADTTRSRPLFTWQDGVLGAGYVLAAVAIAPLDRQVAANMQKPKNKRSRLAERAAGGFNTIAVPGAYLIGSTLYVVGRATENHNMADLGLHGTEALLIGSALGGVLKGVLGRERPYVNADNRNPRSFGLMRGFSDGKYRSFPSGHTLAAFAAASAVTAESGKWVPEAQWAVGAAMYGGAALVGLTRMYDDRHWASDVIIGAAIGTFAGNKVVRYHHDNPENRIDRWLLNFTLAPAMGGGQSLSFSVHPVRDGSSPARR
jgi:membrane-associated phospholipid phosphatase